MNTYTDVNVKRLSMTACFSFDEEQVLCGDELTNGIVTWDARTAARLRSYSGMCLNQTSPPFCEPNIAFTHFMTVCLNVSASVH